MPSRPRSCRATALPPPPPRRSRGGHAGCRGRRWQRWCSSHQMYRRWRAALSRRRFRARARRCWCWQPGPAPSTGAPGVTVVAPTPDGADVARITARAQRHFAAAPGDDPALRWRDSGVSVALLALPLVLMWARRGFLAAAVVGVALGMAQPASAAGADWFWRLWLTPDQRARLAAGARRRGRSGGAVH
jgi:hypothetical protein